MATHGSATTREEAPHATETTITISDAVRRQAHLIIDNTSIDPEWRALIRHYLETNDPWGSAGNWINTDRLYSRRNGGKAVNAGL